MSRNSKLDHTKHERVMVILGSTRAGRLCPTIGKWVIDIARSCASLDFETIDLHDWHLPTDDEPGIPALGKYEKGHTRAWSGKISSAAAIVIVTPQYNWGYPAPLKNALDHLYREWNDKSLVIVSYGGHGGTKCAAQLRQVADGLHMRTVKTMPAIDLTDEIIKGGPVDPVRDFANHGEAVRQAIGELEAQMQQAL